MGIRLRSTALICLPLLAALSACSKKDASPQGDLPVGDELVGRWQSNCVESQALSLSAPSRLGITQRSELDIKGGSVTEVTRITSSACDGNDIEVTSVGPMKATATENAEIRSLDVEVKSILVKPMTEFGVRILNISKWCGFSDWAMDQEKDVTAAIGKDKCFAQNKVTAAYGMKEGRFQFDVRNPQASASQAVEFKSHAYFTRF